MSTETTATPSSKELRKELSEAQAKTAAAAQAVSDTEKAVARGNADASALHEAESRHRAAKLRQDYLADALAVAEQAEFEAEAQKDGEAFLAAHSNLTATKEGETLPIPAGSPKAIVDTIGNYRNAVAHRNALLRTAAASCRKAGLSVGKARPDVRFLASQHGLTVDGVECKPIDPARIIADSVHLAVYGVYVAAGVARIPNDIAAFGRRHEQATELRRERDAFNERYRWGAREVIGQSLEKSLPGLTTVSCIDPDDTVDTAAMLEEHPAPLLFFRYDGTTAGQEPHGTGIRGKVDGILYLAEEIELDDFLSVLGRYRPEEYTTWDRRGPFRQVPTDETFIVPAVPDKHIRDDKGRLVEVIEGSPERVQPRTVDLSLTWGDGVPVDGGIVSYPVTVRFSGMRIALDRIEQRGRI